MDANTVMALLLAVPLGGLGAASISYQVRGRRALAARAHVPSDERAYLRGRHRRRAFAGGIMVLAAGLIGFAYVSGMERRAEAIAAPDPAAPRDDDGKRQMSPDDRAFVRAWGGYWAAVVGLAFLLLAVAVTDAWATRRYWHGLYKAMREEHQVQLRRDLAVYKAEQDQKKASGRNGYGGRL